MADIRLPDGRIIRNVPDGITKSELMRRVGQFDEPEKKGFFSRAGEDIAQRGAAIKDIALGEVGDQTQREDVLQALGQIAGGIADVGGEALVSGVRGLSAITPDIIEEPIKDISKDLGQAIIGTRVGKLGLRSLKRGVGAYNEFRSKHPRAARNLEATFNVGALLLPVKGKPKIKGTDLGKVGTKFTEVAQKITPTRVKALTSDDLKKISSAKYKEAERLGGILKPKALKSVSDAIEKLDPFSEAGKLLRRTDNTVGDALFAPKKVGFTSKLGEVRRPAIDLEKLQNMDEFLTDAMGMGRFLNNGVLNKSGQKILRIQDKLRNVLEKATVEDVVSKKGFRALKEGRILWARSAKLADIEKIITRAQLTDQPASSIKSGLRNILANKSRLKGFSKAEREAMKNAADTGLAEELLRATGSRLVPIGSAVTGGPGTVAATGVLSNIARKKAEKIKLDKIAKLQELIISGGSTKKELPFTGKVGTKVKSFGVLRANQLGETLKFIDNLIVKETDINLIQNLRLDRVAVLEALETFNDNEEGF